MYSASHLASQNIISIKGIKQYLIDRNLKLSKREFNALRKAIQWEYNNTPLNERLPF